ncbi:hypothetical protein COCOBI_07-3690 [Coccomyxa sp. Obi]|nr:hypothetical protein COCOBI_07-3690 [Coccomyxa sp. Obi]
MSRNQGLKRKITDSRTDEGDSHAPALRRRLLDQPGPNGLLGMCFQQQPRFGAFLPSDSNQAVQGTSKPISQRRKLKLPKKLGKPALLSSRKAVPTAGASGMTEPNNLDWDAPEFNEEPSTTSVSSATGAQREKDGDSLAQKAGISSSNAGLFPAAASSPVNDKAGTAGGSGTLLLGSSLGTLPGTAAATLPAAPALPASDASGLTLAAAMPSVPEQENASADNQPFAFAQPSTPDGARGGDGKQPGSGLSLGIFGAVQQSGAVALSTQQAQPPPVMPQLPTQHAQPPSILPGTIFGQQIPEQVGGFAAGAPQAQPRKMVRAKRFSRK